MKPMTPERERLADDLTSLTGGTLPEVEFEHLLEYVAGRISPPNIFQRFWRVLQRR